MSDRTVVISDLHLGREIPATLVAENLRPIWREADHLVINGDVAEVHHPRHRGRAARQMVRLAELCEADGTSLTLLSGNHDPYLSDVRHLMLAGRNVLVTHGDALHPAIAPWSPAAGRMESAYAKALATLAPTDAATLSARLAAAQHACHEEWNAMAEQAGRSSVVRMLLRPHAVAKVLHYWHIFPGLAEQFVRHHAPDATFVLLGHTHHAGIWPLHGRVIINTGAFVFPGRPRAAVLEGNALSVHRIRRYDGLYDLAEQPIVRYRLPVAPDRGAEAPSAVKTRPGRGRPSAAAM